MVPLQVACESLPGLSGGAFMNEDLLWKHGNKPPRMYMMNISKKWRVSIVYSVYAITTERQMHLQWLSTHNGTRSMTRTTKMAMGLMGLQKRNPRPWWLSTMIHLWPCPTLHNLIWMYNTQKTTHLQATTGQHWWTYYMFLLDITMLLMPINHSSNIFNKPDSQFQILESISNVIQKVEPNAN